MLDPNTFIQTVNDSMNAMYMEALQESTAQWEARNSGDTISGSAISKCVRLCYYRWFDEDNRQAKDPAFTDKLNDQSKRNMYFGLLVEDLLIQALRKQGIPGSGIVHKDQDKPPVVLTDTEQGIIRSAANDMVIEALDDEGKFFIPTECKTTDRMFSYNKGTGVDKVWVTPQKWWESFNGYDEHKRQVMQWIWLAHKNGMRVPFGCLWYLRRGTWDTKFIIILVKNDTIDIPGAFEVVDYNYHSDAVRERNEQLVTSITTNVEPAYDPSIPKFICEGCNYYERCKKTR